MKRIAWNAGNDDDVQINLSPLIDCVFLLLIFFIVTSVFVDETGVEVQKPKAVAARPLDKYSLQIALTKDGDIIYDRQSIPLNSVRSVVARHLEERKTPVVILADADSRAGLIVDVIDECKLAGAEIVSLAAGVEDE